MRATTQINGHKCKYREPRALHLGMPAEGFGGEGDPMILIWLGKNPKSKQAHESVIVQFNKIQIRWPHALQNFALHQHNFMAQTQKILVKKDIVRLSLQSKIWAQIITIFVAWTPK
ncbi:hypothetical protein ACJX0J_016687 [Zea mays]